jgi:GNAT superfamily N-acetyltransferase
MTSELALRVAARFQVARMLEAADLHAKDKKVIEAFVRKEPSDDGSILTTDGHSLHRMAMGGEKVAVWMGPKIRVVSTESTKFDSTILRYLIKVAGKGMVYFDYDRDGVKKALTFATGGEQLYRGQYDGWITAHVPWRDPPVGRLDYSVAPVDGRDQYLIKMVEVDAEYKRAGIATELYKHLFRENHITQKDLAPAMHTDEGSAFREHTHFAMAIRVAARYKTKKKVKTQDGEDMTVYEYSDRQIANRNKKKAERIEKLRKGIEKLRSKVKKDLHSQDPEKTLTALAVALMDCTYERVGNDESAKDGHFGVTGWRRKHVSFGKGGVTIKYVGKSNVKHEKKVSDPAIKAALKEAYDAVEDDNDEILSWDGGRITADKVNKYLAQFDITAKDLRGFHANREMQERLKDVRKSSGKLPEDKKKREKQLKDEFKEALEGAADAVGHEASTLRSQYLVPGLEETYLKDGTVSDKLGFELG